MGNWEWGIGKWGFLKHHEVFSAFEIAFPAHLVSKSTSGMRDFGISAGCL
jgi:hypothetical protein